jgi:hypothetical protein
MSDPTENIRRVEQAVINASAGPREEMEAKYGQVWDTQEMQAEFTVTGFAAPYVVVTKKDTGEKGSLQFAHSPRFYFNWKAD